jgi:quinol monooxygenase YgiN/antitoxin (DNA-binding transcriptional repressor) of toxin-antitoxin stability system
MPTVNMLEARSTLLRLVGAVESGAEKVIIIARNGRPAAKLVAIKPAQTGKRIGGSPKASSSSPTRSTLMMKPRSPRCSPGNPSEAAARHPHRPPRRPSPCHCVCSRTTPALRNTAIRLSWFDICVGAILIPQAEHPMELFIFARFHSREGQQDAVAAALRDVIPPTRAEPGCRAVEAYRSTRDPLLFYIHSCWKDEAAFDHHAELPHTVQFLKHVQPLIDHPLDVTRSRPIGYLQQSCHRGVSPEQAQR